MLAHEKGLQRREGTIFIRPHIAGYAKSGAGIGFVRNLCSLKALLLISTFKWSVVMPTASCAAGSDPFNKYRRNPLGIRVQLLSHKVYIVDES